MDSLVVKLGLDKDRAKYYNNARSKLPTEAQEKGTSKLK
jgi:hypothetical protein